MLKIGQKQKNRLWGNETLILEVIFLTLTENLSVLTNDTKDYGNIHTAGNTCSDTLPWERWH